MDNVIERLPPCALGGLVRDNKTCMLEKIKRFILA